MFWIYWAVGLTISSVIGALVVRKNRMLGYAALTCFFAIYVVGANLLVGRLVTINLGIGIYVCVTGTLVWPFTAQAVDMINEIYGRKKAYFAAGMAYLINIIMISFFFMSKYMTPIGEPAAESWFLAFFAITPRIFLASLIDFTIIQLIDINIFHKLKVAFRKIEEKALPAKWLGLVSIRSFTTDIINMALDAVIFSFLAFVGVFDAQFLMIFILNTLVVKVLISLFDTPWFTLFRLMTKGVEREF